MVRQLKWKLVDFAVAKRRKLKDNQEVVDELVLLAKAGNVWRTQLVKVCGKDAGWWQDAKDIRVVARSTKVGGEDVKARFDAIRLMEAL